MTAANKKRKPPKKARKRLVVGLTGTFGSGKSSVGRLFREAGAKRVVDSDHIVHRVFEQKHPLQRRIRTLFDTDVLDRKRIAEIVFRDAGKRKALERILHPYVFAELKKEIAGIQKGIIVLEIPLLFETGADRLCDFTVAVVSGKENIFQRMQGRGFEAQEVSARQKSQLSESEKKRRSDFIIDNSKSKQYLRKQVKEVWNCLSVLID